MTERLAALSARLDNIRQLDAIVTAMRGIAAGRAQQSRTLLAGIEAYAGAMSRAIGEAIRFAPRPVAEGQARAFKDAIILFCAEQGFAGGFNDDVLDAASPALTGAEVLLIGSRGALVAQERGIRPVWTAPMASDIGAVAGVAEKVADALYGRIARGTVAGAEMFYPTVDAEHTVRVTRLRLLPLDLPTFRAAPSEPPLVTLEPDTLLAGLAAEYVYALLIGAAMHAFAAENAARLVAMSAASDNIGRTMEELTQREHQLRQEEVTAEIVELAVGVAAQRNR